MIEINDLIGKPFTSDPDKACGPDAYSCYGLLVEVYRRHGIIVPKTNISVTACKEASNKEIERRMALEWEPIDHPEIPCGVLIQSTQSGFANHIGVCIDPYRMLHITINRNVVVDRISSWQRKIIGFYQYVGNDYSHI